MRANDEFHKKKTDELIKDNRQITQKKTAVKLGISQEHVGHITDVLQYRKVLARRVPHMLMANTKTLRVEICQQFLSHYENKGEKFLHNMVNMVTADKTWMHHYQPKTKHQSMEYHYT